MPIAPATKQSLNAQPSRAVVENPQPFFQPKLTVNQPNDVYEQEADAMADKVMRMTDSAPGANAFFKPSNNALQRKCQACEEEDKHVHRKEGNAGETNGGSIDSYVSNLSSAGQQLSASSRSFFEPKFGYDFSNVKIHTDASAAKSAKSINALAYTTGNNIVFNAGQYAPDSDSGKKLMAHELTHVVQQSGSVGPKLIQRSCSLGHLDKECGDAAASCHTVDDYCAKKYSTTADQQALHDGKVKDAKDKAAALPLASVNLLHYLDNSGSLLTMPAASFAAETATKEKLKTEHRNKFIAGAIARLNDGRLVPGTTADMEWTGTANAFSQLDDMAFAVGGYTLCSKVTVKAVATGSGTFTLSFEKWTVQGFDCYNWDPGKGIGVLGADDKDLCCIENAGLGKHFRIQTDPWDNKQADSMGDEVVSATVPAPTSPAPTKSPSAWERFTDWLR